MNMLAIFVDWIIRLVILLVVVDVVLSYFTPPDQPVRRTLDRIVEPMLAPIRRLIPSTGQIDFSPIVLMLALMLLEQVLQSLIRRL